MSFDIVFYCCFFGSDYNWSNIFPNCPSKKYPCYYFTNNTTSFKRAEEKGWKCILLENIPIKQCMIQSAFDSKHLKSCPHLYDILNQHRYICYFDTKHNVDETKIETYVQRMEKNEEMCMILPEHPNRFHEIWEEFYLAMTYDKYASEKEKNLAYIYRQLENNFSDLVQTHYTTQFILRKNNDISKQINEIWYSHILECGIMCQLSFFFVQQIFPANISKIAYQECYCYC